MNRLRPVHIRQSSSGSSSGTSPSTSPLHQRSRPGSSASTATSRKPQNNAAKVAAQRLAQVMANQYEDDGDDDEDDLPYDYNPIKARPSIGLTGIRGVRPPSPMAIRPPSVVESKRTSLDASARSMPSKQFPYPGTQPSPSHAAHPNASSLAASSMEQPPSARVIARSSISISSNEQPPSGRSVHTTYLSTKPVPVLSSNVPIQSRSTPVIQQDVDIQPSPPHVTIKNSASQISTSTEQPPSSHSVGRSSIYNNSKEKSSTGRAVPVSLPYLSTKPVQVVSSNVSISSRNTPPINHDGINDKWLSLKDHHSKEIQSEYSTCSLKDELGMLQEENENLVEKLRIAEARCQEAEIITNQLREQLQVNDGGGKSNRQMEAIERMFLTHEEMEEVVLKRCWLARYWGLCLQYDIHVDIAKDRYSYWVSFAPLPTKVVLAAGQRATQEREPGGDSREACGERNMESMLQVDKGIKEMAFLKVEDAIGLAMAQQRFPNSLRSDSGKWGEDGLADVSELSEEESEDVRFKQAWLSYFWRRANEHGIEPDISEDRLQLWNESTLAAYPLTSRDAVDVSRGVAELNKLSIESQLWEEARKINPH